MLYVFHYQFPRGYQLICSRLERRGAERNRRWRMRRSRRRENLRTWQRSWLRLMNWLQDVSRHRKKLTTMSPPTLSSMASSKKAWPPLVMMAFGHLLQILNNLSSLILKNTVSTQLMLSTNPPWCSNDGGVSFTSTSRRSSLSWWIDYCLRLLLC